MDYDLPKPSEEDLKHASQFKPGDIIVVSHRVKDDSEKRAVTAYLDIVTSREEHCRHHDLPLDDLALDNCILFTRNLGYIRQNDLSKIEYIDDEKARTTWRLCNFKVFEVKHHPDFLKKQRLDKQVEDLLK